MDIQTLLIVPIVALAVAYVGRSVWPPRRSQTGCRTCSHNPNRADDYV